MRWRLCQFPWNWVSWSNQTHQKQSSPGTDRNGANIVWWESVGWWLNQLCKYAHVDSIFKSMIDLLSDYGKPLHSPIWCLSTNGVCLTHLLRKYNYISKIGNYFAWTILAFLTTVLFYMFDYYLIKMKLFGDSYLKFWKFISS